MQTGQGALDLRLDRRAVQLYLPSDVARAVVLERELHDGHAAELSTRPTAQRHGARRSGASASGAPAKARSCWSAALAQPRPPHDAAPRFV